MDNKNSITVSTGYGYNTRSPYVEIEGLNEVQISPQEARELAQNLAAAAEAAESDAFLVEFVSSKLDGSDAMAANLLYEFREWRENLWREKYGIKMETK